MTCWADRPLAGLLRLIWQHSGFFASRLTPFGLAHRVAGGLCWEERFLCMGLFELEAEDGPWLRFL